MAIIEDSYEEEVDVSHVPELPPVDDLKPPSDLHEVEPFFSLNALISFFSPQTLKLIRYIRNQK
jgi:hypothetical protein